MLCATRYIKLPLTTVASQSQITEIWPSLVPPVYWVSYPETFYYVSPAPTDLFRQTTWPGDQEVGWGKGIRATKLDKREVAHYNDVIIDMSETASQITGVTICLLNCCSGADQSKHLSSVSLTFVDKWQVNSPHKGPITRKMFPLNHYWSSE